MFVICSALALGVCPPAAVLQPCQCESFPDGHISNEGTLKFDCSNRNLPNLNLGDEKMSVLLDHFISTRGVSPLRELHLNDNKLTRIPDESRYFTELNWVELDGNQIGAIKKGSFNTSQPLLHLGFYGNKITSIEPGAFSGNDYLLYYLNELSIISFHCYTVKM